MGSADERAQKQNMSGGDAHKAAEHQQQQQPQQSAAQLQQPATAMQEHDRTASSNWTTTAHQRCNAVRRVRTNQARAARSTQPEHQRTENHKRTEGRMQQHIGLLTCFFLQTCLSFILYSTDMTELLLRVQPTGMPRSNAPFQHPMQPQDDTCPQKAYQHRAICPQHGCNLGETVTALGLSGPSIRG